MKKMYTRAEALVAGAAVLGLAACGGTTTTDEADDAASSVATDDSASSATEDTASTDGDLGLVTEGKLTVAMSPDFPPFENLDDNGDYYGFDVDLATLIAEEMGLEVEFKNLQFDSIVTAIAAGGQADTGISGMTIKPDREEQVDFSTPYYIDDLSVVVMKDNADVTEDTYEDALNVEGTVIAVQSGTTSESYVQENFPNATCQPYGNATDCFAAMQAGQAQAVFTNMAVAADMVADDYTDAQVIKNIATGEEYACAVSKDNPTLLAAINDAIAAIDEAGKIDELNTKYFGA